MTSTRDGWRNDATAQMAEQIQEDPVLLLETLDRINHLAAGQTPRHHSRPSRP